jgi:hypothetical protein
MMRLAFALLAAGLAWLPATASAEDGPVPQSVQGPASPPESKPVPPAPAMPAPTPPAPPVPNVPAVQAAPKTEDGRYTLHRLQDSFVRLDTRTGQVSTCGRSDAGWSCQSVPDERSAFESEIARLQSDNAALKTELLTHGLALPNGIKADPLARPGKPPTAQTPSEAQLDNAMAFVERVWRRMVEIMANAQRDMQQHKN